MSAARLPVVVLISGRGSNLQAIIAAIAHDALPVDIRAVISNRPDAPGLQFARDAGIPVAIVDHRAFPDRAAFDKALAEAIDAHAPKLVVLAGFMRVLGADFVRHYEGRMINIHPSLLPEFPGLDTHARALAAGRARHGATVHFVTPAVDGGPAIVQAAVPVRADDTPDTLAERVLNEEHRILPLVLRWFAENRLTIRDGRVLVDGRERSGAEFVR